MLECTVKEITEVGPKDIASLQEKHPWEEQKGKEPWWVFHLQQLMWVGCWGVYVKQSLFGMIQKVKKIINSRFGITIIDMWIYGYWRALQNLNKLCAEERKLQYNKMTTYHRNWKTYLKYDRVKTPSCQRFEFLCSSSLLNLYVDFHMEEWKRSQGKLFYPLLWEPAFILFIISHMRIKAHAILK